MNKYIKLLITIIAIVAVFVGIVLLYNGLIKDYKPESNLVGNNTGTEADVEEDMDNVEDSTEDDTSEDIKALDFTVVDIDNVETTLLSNLGKPIVVNFWASWCSPCKAELPDFELAYQEYGDEVVFMMINMTGSGETVEAASGYINASGYTFPVYYDVNQAAAYTYSVTSIPTTFFIDAEGNIAAYAQGMIDYETILQGIEMAK